MIIPGYDTAVGTASVTSSTSSTVNRVIGRVDASGTVNTTTGLTDAISGGSPRGATSTNGNDLWISGTSSGGGIRYATFGATTSTSLSTTLTNLRATNIFGGQLYVSSQSGAFRLATVGSGTPTTSGQTITNLPGFPTATGSPYAFFFADLDATVAGVDTLYVADDSAAASGGGMVGGNWVAKGTIAIPTAGVTSVNVRGLTASVSGGNVTLYATSSSDLFSFTDTTGYNTTVTGTATAIAAAPSNTAFRGVAFAPVPIISINDVAFTEGDGGTKVFSFTVSLSTASASNVTFDIATQDVTANAGSDYVARSLTTNRLYNSGFVSIEYFGFMRRDPDDPPDTNLNGFNFWLQKMDAHTLAGEDARIEATAFARIKRAEMIRAFILAGEYRQRFGP